MDVDLLRPGAVPISPDTVLGFEFLLDRNLLLKHLQRPNADPSPTNLITKFYDVVAFTLHLKLGAENPETINLDPNDSMKIKHPAKNIAMKILALKVAAYLKWNLAKIRSLPFKTQINLLQDLMYFTSEDKTVMEIPNIENADTKTASPQFLFALLLFHRWLLNTSMHRVTSNNWHQRYGINDMSPTDETIICCPDNIQKTITFLQDALNWDRKDVPFLPTFECFNMPTEQNDSIDFEWNKALCVTREEFCAQISYDLGTFFFYRENYEEAKNNFTKCYQYFMQIKTSSGLTDIDKETLEVYCRACDPTIDVLKRSLLEQLSNSIASQYVGITAVLQQDNLVREIPLVQRINLELDIQGAVSSGAFTVARDLLFKVKALNHIRCAIEGTLFLSEFSLNNAKSLDALIWAVQINWKAHNEYDKKQIKNYFFELILKNEIPDLLQKIQQNDVLGKIFDKSELQYILEKDTSCSRDVPQSFFTKDFSFFEATKKRIPSVELRLLEQKLLNSYDTSEIKDILLKMLSFKMSSNIGDVNPLWQLPIPLQSVVKTLPRGFLQHYAYVLLAKSKEQLSNKNWLQAVTLLIILNKELEGTNVEHVSKLQKMINWEVILVQITQILEEWPKTLVDKDAFADACEVCLQTNESVVPRTEIIEACALCLLNFGRWEFLMNYETRWTTFNFEATAALALACHEANKNKGSKKFTKNLWDIVLPVFSPNPPQQKRGGSGYVDPTSNNNKSILTSIFLKLKDSWCLTVVISLLTRLFNVFKDEPSLELQVDYVGLWPSTVSNASSYSVEAVSEMLTEVIAQALKDYPINIPWLRLMGDINFANGNYKISLAYYLKSLLICSDYFNIPIRNDDHVFRRMIKSCQSLGCYTQAAVLCQFLDEPDYTLAFRILSEQKTCNDAVDAYYHCFWDTTILEFLINMHNRRGEFQRRKTAIQVMGMLELNSNNNEEIQREASNLRKSVFLRALCKQYVF